MTEYLYRIRGPAMKKALKYLKTRLDFCTPKCYECQVCSKPLNFMLDEEEPKQMECFYCKKIYPTRIFCSDGHFVCKDCWKEHTECPLHSSKGPEAVRSLIAERLGIPPSDIEIREP